MRHGCKRCASRNLRKPNIPASPLPHNRATGVLPATPVPDPSVRYLLGLAVERRRDGLDIERLDREADSLHPVVFAAGGVGENLPAPVRAWSLRHEEGGASW